MHYKRTGVGHGVQALMEDESHNVGAQGVGEDSACARVLRLWQPCSLSAALSSAPTARRGRGGGGCHEPPKAGTGSHSMACLGPGTRETLGSQHAGQVKTPLSTRTRSAAPGWGGRRTGESRRFCLLCDGSHGGCDGWGGEHDRRVCASSRLWVPTVQEDPSRYRGVTDGLAAVPSP